MSHLVDDLARILASPTPRRKTLKLLGGALAGGLLGTLGVKRADAATCFPACRRGEFCCTSGSRPFCTPVGTTCCGNSACLPFQTCCSNGSNHFCAPFGWTCCGNGSCFPGQKCCNTGARPFCTSVFLTCCGSTTCGPNQTCCGNTSCCGFGQQCVGGRCTASRGRGF